MAGRIDYISNPKRQEYLYATYQTEGATSEFWKNLARENQLDFKASGSAGKCIEGREFIIALPESFVQYSADDVVRLFTETFHRRYDVECSAALHHNKTKTNYHIHLVFSERKMLQQPEVKIATRNMFYDGQGNHRRTKKEILDEQGNLRAGRSIISKGEVYESHIFTKKEEWFKNKAFTKEVKELFIHTINCYVKEDAEKLSVFQQGGVYLATKKIGKNNPKAEEIKVDNATRQEWNRTVDVALVEGVPEEDILKIKQEKITDKTLQSIRTYGWLPDMFCQIIRGAKEFLQEMIFKFKLLPKPVPKIDLQEWKDMQKVMEKLQKQSQEVKNIQQEISFQKKQLSEIRGFFKGKERKSLERKIEQAEKSEKRMHTNMAQIAKEAGYPDV
ncbi:MULTISPECIES: MobA/MobL family protein [Clostridium]|uniref:MobA/MobL family protein n=1 Tax=Clostridium TaxID=1485 RepID=UPI00290CBCE4|nr:MobA/MobL family protein [Clostridium sp.]